VSEHTCRRRCEHLFFRSTGMQAQGGSFLRQQSTAYAHARMAVWEHHCACSLHLGCFIPSGMFTNSHAERVRKRALCMAGRQIPQGKKIPDAMNKHSGVPTQPCAHAHMLLLHGNCMYR